MGRCGDESKNLPGVLDIRTVGLTATGDLSSRPDAVGKRAYEAMERAFHEGPDAAGYRRNPGVDTPLIMTEDQMGEIFESSVGLSKQGPDRAELRPFAAPAMVREGNCG
jgi:beta-alanine--pyruvate transaminase